MRVDIHSKGLFCHPCACFMSLGYIWGETQRTHQAIDFFPLLYIYRVGRGWKTGPSAQKNMKLCSSLVPGRRSLAGGPLWYREGGIACGETRDSLAESQVAARGVPAKRWIARHAKDRPVERFNDLASRFLVYLASFIAALC